MRICALVTLFVILGLATFETVGARANVDTIATIRSQYASINNNIGRYKKVKKDAPGYSAEGGTLEAYFDGKSIKKIAAHFYGEMGRTDEEYYYWNDKLIFVFRKVSNYDRPLSGKVISKKENRYYFDDGHMIKWLNEEGREVPSSSSEFGEKEHEYLESSGELAKLARS